MTKDTKRFIGNLGQWLALLILILAIVFMLIQRKDFAQFLVTLSSVFFAIVTKIKYYTARKEPRKRIPISALRWRNGRLTVG